MRTNADTKTRAGRGALFRTLAAIAVATATPIPRAGAQDAASGRLPADPTQPPAALADALKEPLAGFGAVTLKAAVVSADRGGVALLEVRDRGPVRVRKGSAFMIAVAGLPVPIVVREISPAGVAIEAPTLGRTLWLTGASGAQPPPAGGAPPDTLLHVEFHDVPLEDAIRLLAEQGRTNYSASAEAAKVRVTLFLRNVSPDTAIGEICKSRGLWYRKDEEAGVLRILTMEEFERDLVSFREEQTEVFTLLYPNVQEVASVLQNIYGDRLTLSLGRDDIHDDADDLAERFRRFSIMDRNAGSDTSGYGGYGLTAYGGSATVISTGGPAWTSEARSPSTARPAPRPAEFEGLTPEQAQKVQRLIEAAPSTPEAEAALEEFRRRPASIYVTISRRHNMLIVRTSDPRALEDIRQLVRRMDVPTPMVLLEVKILSVRLGDGFNSVFDYQFNTVAESGGGAAVVGGGFTQGEILPPAAGSMAPTGSGLRAGDMTFQVVNEYFRARLQLLEERDRVTVLATPMLLTAHNEVSRLFIGEERPIVRNVSSQTILTEGNVATAPSTAVEFRDVGTTLLITPNINSDRTVTLRLFQENSMVNPAAASIPVVLSTGAVQNVAVDVVSSRVISGTFVARDQMAVAVGGIIEEKKSDIRAGVPLLGRIPLLGLLFRRQSTETTRNELVIMIRPYVISTPSDGEAISRELLRGLAVHAVPPEGSPSLGTFREADRGTGAPEQ